MQSKCHKIRQSRRLQSMRAGHAAWRVSNEAQRRAEPPRLADPAPGAPTMCIDLHGPGWAHSVRLLIPAIRGTRRPRSDQYTVEIDGQNVADRMGMVALLDMLRTRYLPRQVTRSQRAEFDVGVSARDWADAALA